MEKHCYIIRNLKQKKQKNKWDIIPLFLSKTLYMRKYIYFSSFIFKNAFFYLKMDNKWDYETHCFKYPTVISHCFFSSPFRP